MQSEIKFLFLFLCSFSTNVLFSQIVGGYKSGQSTPSTVAPSAITSGSVAGDVNLFTGTYGTSYSLGSVSTIAGLNYDLKISNSSTISSGDNLPNSSGIPYGEGWNLDIPTINVSVQDYNRFSIWQANRIGSRNNSNDPNFPTKTYYQTISSADPNIPFIPVNHAEKEGGLFWYSPMLNIPGVASGRLVYKYEHQGNYIFTLHTFDRYIEAYFDGTRWEVALDDGTRYELAEAVVSNRNPSNQRVEQACYPASNPPFPTGGAIENLVLPKREILTWNCIKIFNKNMIGNIQFKYKSFGKIDFFKVYKQERFEKELIAQWGESGFLDVAARDIVLTEISTMGERLILDYENIPVTGGSNLLDITSPDVTQVDSMYAFETVYEEGGSSSTPFSGWKNYLHAKSDVFLNANETNIFNENTNPYHYKLAGLTNTHHGYHHKDAVGDVNQGHINFRDGFLESPRLNNFKMIPGEIYKIESYINSDEDLANVTHGGALFDINLASGDPCHNLPCPGSEYSTGFEGESVPGWLPKNYYDASRGKSIFSTFQQAVKWGAGMTSRNGSGMAIMKTENFFVMPANPPNFAGFHVQIGPAISDNDFTKAFDQVDSVSVCNTYFNSYGNGVGGNLNTGDNLPNNFGIGLPLHMMQENFYNGFLVGRDYCNTNDNSSVLATQFWWNDGFSGNHENQPTLTRKPNGTNGLYFETELQKVIIKRYSKTPYMLVGVKKVVLQEDMTNPLPANFADLWRPVAQLELSYRIETFKRYVSFYEAGSTNVTSQELVNRESNAFVLETIKQLPIEGDLSTVNRSILPTTTFGYLNTALQNKDINVTGLGVKFNGNFVLLNKIIDPLGKITIIGYRSYGNNRVNGYTLEKFRYRSRSAAIDPTYLRATNPYAFQTYFVVNRVSVIDENNSKKIWSYRFYWLKVIDDIPPFSDKFTFDHKYAKRAGFSKTRVIGPAQDGKRSHSWYFHKTTEENNLLWGKLYDTRKYEETSSSPLIERTKYTYEANLAFEPPGLRKRKNNNRSNYYDYRDDPDADGGISSRPTIDAFPNDYSGYVSAVRSYIDEYLSSAVMKNWLEDREDIEQYLVDNAQLIECEDLNDNIYTCDCFGMNWQSLTDNSRVICNTYFDELFSWARRRPHDSDIKNFLPHPDHIRYRGTYDTPKFYESHFQDYILDQDPIYLSSYFIKKTKEETTNFEAGCSNGVNEEFTTTTEYEYFDADYRGYTSRKGFEEAHLPYDVNNDNYEPWDNGHSTLLDGLAWEPSWQLYSKKTYNNQTGGANGAYTLEENFYLFDLKNEPAFQRDPSPNVEGFRHLKNGLYIIDYR